MASRLDLSVMPGRQTSRQTCISSSPQMTRWKRRIEVTGQNKWCRQGLHPISKIISLERHMHMRFAVTNLFSSSLQYRGFVSIFEVFYGIHVSNYPFSPDAAGRNSIEEIISNVLRVGWFATYALLLRAFPNICI